VDEVELDDDTDEDEFVLCTVFLCGMNIRDTSSALIEFNPFGAAPLFHPSRGSDWKLGGEATAVVIEEVFEEERKSVSTQCIILSSAANYRLLQRTPKATVLVSGADKRKNKAEEVFWSVIGR
jgi:hypothetical protein